MFYRSLLIEVVRQKVEMELANKNKILSGEEFIIVSIYIYIYIRAGGKGLNA